MKTTIKKFLSVILIVQMLFLNLVPLSARAEEPVEPTPVVEQASTTTEAPATPESTTTTESSTDPVQSGATTTPSPTVSATTSEYDEEAAEEAAEREALLERRARSAAAREAYLASVEGGDPNRTESATSAYVVGVGSNGGGTVGSDSSITTGDATSTGAVITSANNNLAGSAGVIESSDGAQVVTSGNGPGSTSNGALTIDNNSATIQDNDADVSSALTQSATSGGNNNSTNVGGDSSIDTGDANVTGTIITAVNTNVDGVMVSEFNIADNHVGDILLDFGAGCVSGCGTGPTTVANTGNGSDSTNNASIDETNSNTTLQTNDAIVGSVLTLNADSGNNTSSSNVGGDSNIQTGDANVAGNVLTFANTNVAGDVIFAVVNIFGDLIGDIIMTEEAINACCGGTNLSAINTGNGPDSTNNAGIDIENNDTVIQTNDAVIDNNLILDAQTGNNSASSNVGGNAAITTGDADVKASLLNVVNTNLLSGNMWLVLVNEAGNWVGKLLGAPEGTNFAMSSGGGYTVDENGYITVTNSGNGEGSNNTGEVNQTNNNTTTQTNTAVVGNTLDLSANTGGNAANRNTGGDSNITTGDATIIANLVNFVNTNIAGSGKLVVTVVNVFGSWFGDFITPGQQKNNQNNNTTQTASTGGGPTNSQQTNNSSNQNVNTHSTQNSSVTGGGVVAGVQQFAQQFGGFVARQGTSGGTVSVSSGDTKVAGASTANTKNLSLSKKKTTINLAWLVLLIPLLNVIVIGRKLVVKKLISRKFN